MPGKCDALCLAMKAKCGKCKVSPVIFVILQIIIVLFTIFGVCFDQFRPKKDYKNLLGCVSLWEYKEPGSSCISGKKLLKTTDMFDFCTKRRTRFRSAEALGIIAIIFVAVALVLGIIRLCCCSALKFVILVFNFIAFVFLCVVWAQMAAVYNSNDDKDLPAVECLKLKDIKGLDGKSVYKYGSGFGLAVTAWCLLLINIIVCLLPC